MEQLSARINSLPVSETLAMAAKARELKNQGIDIIGLSLGEPDFNTPEFIKDAAIDAVNENWNSYSPVDGYADLKEAICKKFKRDNGLDYKPSQVVVSTGAKQSIANLCMVLLDPGDEVLLPAPYWVSYSAIATLAEAKSIIIPSTIETDFKITPEQLEAAITPKTKLVMFNSPNNPSGTIYTEAEYRALGKVLEKYPDIYILSDEIYEHINYGTAHFSIAAIPELYDRTITVNGVAKAESGRILEVPTKSSFVEFVTPEFLRLNAFNFELKSFMKGYDCFVEFALALGFQPLTVEASELNAKLTYPEDKTHIEGLALDNKLIIPVKLKI